MHSSLCMVLRIDRTTEGRSVVMTLSGHVTLDEMLALRQVLQAEATPMLIIDIRDVIQLNEDGIALLAALEKAGSSGELKENKPAAAKASAAEHDAERERQLAAMVCSLENKEACVMCSG